MVPGHHCRVAKHPKISEIIQIIVLLFELYILKHIIFILKPIICCFSKNPSPSYYTLLYGYYTHYTYYFIYSSITNSSCLLFLSTVLSDEDTGPPNQDDEQDPPAGMQTPPTPPPPSSTCYCAASDAGPLGIYPILSVLPDKFARFLFEFHSVRFKSLDLPPLPADRSNFDVHGALEDDKVKICKGLYYMYCDTYMYYIYYSWISCQIR